MKWLAKKPLAFRISLLAFVFLCAVWIFYCPHDSDRVYSAIPVQSSVVSEHYALGKRWDGLVEDPVLISLAGTFGVSEQRWRQVLGDKNLSRALRHIARRETVIGYVSPTFPGAPYAVVAASWVGWRAHIVRWILASGRIDSLERLDLADGREVWVREFAPHHEGRSPRFAAIAVVEGVVLAYYGANPRTLDLLVHRAERRSPPLQGIGRDMPSQKKELGVSFRDTDRVVYYLDPYRSKEQVRRRVSAWFRFAEAGDYSGHLHADSDLLAGWGTDGQNKRDWSRVWQSLRTQLGENAVAVARLPREKVLSLLLPDEAAASRKAAGIIMDRVSQPDSPVLLCILKEQRYGRILGKVPTLAIGIPLLDGADGVGAAVDLLDCINAKRGWSLIPRHTRIDGFDVMVVETSRPNQLYTGLGERDHPSVFVSGEMLYVLSNTRAYSWLGNPKEVGEEGWTLGSLPAGPDAGVWLDGARFSHAIKNGLEVAKLILALTQPENAKSIRAGLDTASQTLPFWALFESAEFRIRDVGRGQVVSFSLREGR